MNENFDVEYFEKRVHPFFRIREKREYGRVWGLTIDEATELWMKLGDALEDAANAAMEDTDEPVDGCSQEQQVPPLQG